MLAALVPLAPNTDLRSGLVFAQDYYGIFHTAEYSLLLGVNSKDRLLGIGTRQQILAKYKVAAHR